MYVYVNDKKLLSTEIHDHGDWYNPTEAGWYLTSTGSRTLFLKLREGDTVSIRTGGMAGAVWHIHTCFHLETAIL